MQRWAWPPLLAYEYGLVYRPARENSHADALSRLSLQAVPETTPMSGDIIYHYPAATPIDATKVTDREQVMSGIQQFVLH